jgi:saccharopine dehydrogenase-like NADP-dependent oxidoreductase
MRVVVLGGAGGMARPAIERAGRLDGIDEVVVADLDGDRAAAVAAAVGGPTRWEVVDATDGAGLTALLDPADVVMNFVGPYYRFGVGPLRAAVDAGCHYLDVCDDWEPTLELLDLSPAAAPRSTDG